MNSTLDKFLEEAKSWQGTPHKPNQALKGSGVDCVRFPVAVARTMGWQVETPQSYSQSANGESLMCELSRRLFLVGAVDEAYDWSIMLQGNTMPKPKLLSLAKPGDILVTKNAFKSPPGHLPTHTHTTSTHTDQQGLSTTFTLPFLFQGFEDDFDWNKDICAFNKFLNKG